MYLRGYSKIDTNTNKGGLLKNSQTKESLVFNTVPIVFYTAQPSSKFNPTYISKNVKKITGYETNDFGKNTKLWESRLHPDDKKTAINAVKHIVDKSAYDLEYRWKCANGEYIWFYDHAELIYDTRGKAKEIAGSWKNITERKVTEQSVNLLIRKTSTVTGKDFFTALVKNISEILDVNYVFISKCLNKEKTRVKTLAFWEKNKYADDLEYDLDGTPCKNVISGEFCFHDKDVVDLYPNDEDLINYDAKGYLGVPIYNSKNIVIGHLAIFHDDSFKDISKYFSVLKIFALRASTEMERIETEESLRRSHDKLQGAFDEIKKLHGMLEKENISLKEEIKTVHNFEEIVGNGEGLKNVIEQAQVVANTDATVLLRGETGTGKELIARYIHISSKRSDRSLIKINCPAIPSGLIESELFGHEKGAFTGALTQKIGKFELADNGTIFLDELGDLPLDAQAKLLRILQEQEFERVGGTKTHKINVRVIAATNRNLEEDVKEGKFRQDLYYRLNVFPIVLPPLRERINDLLPLSIYFMKKYSDRIGKKFNKINDESVKKLKGYNWPGNIRELENIIERAVILCNDEFLNITENLISSFNTQNLEDYNVTALEEVERNHIIKILDMTNWQVNG